MKAYRDWVWQLIGMLLFSILMFFIYKPSSPLENLALIPTESPQKPDHFSDALQSITDQDLDSAINSLMSALESVSEDTEVLYLLGLIFSVTDPDRSPGYLGLAAAIDPEYQTNARSMIAAIQTAGLAESPSYQQMQIGQTLGGISNWPLAFAAFSNAVTLDPDYAEAWAYLGMSQMQLQQDSSQALLTALELDSNSITANIFYAQYLEQNGEPEKGLPYIHTALELEPGNISLIHETGYYNARMGNLIEAYSYFEEVLILEPEQFDSWHQLANFCINYEYNVAEIGLPAARQAFMLFPNDPEGLVLLGRAYSLIGNPTMGIKLIKETLQMSPKDINALYYMGLINISLGNFAEAESYFLQVIANTSDQSIITKVQSLLDTFIP